MGKLPSEKMSDLESTAGAEAEAAKMNMSGDTESWLKAKNENSELRQSVAKKGSNSYYYAHAASNNGAQSQPTLLSRIASGEEKAPPKTIEKYLFMDDGQKVKVYVELEAIGECKKGVNCVFDISEFDLTITDYNGCDHRLLVDDLQCKVTVKANKIIVSLHKEVRSSWYKLRKG